MSGISSILNKVAETTRSNRKKELEAMKQAFVPMPGGEAPVDPATAGAPMDPSAEGMPMGTAAGGAIDPAMLAAVSGQAGMPEMMAAQGAPVNPAMAMAGGAPLPQDIMAQPAAPAPAEEVAPAPPEGKKPSEKKRTDERLSNIEGMLNTIMGALMAKGMLQPDVIPATQGINSSTPAEAAPDAVESMGEPVAAEAVPAQVDESKAAASKSLAKNLAEALSDAFKITQTK